MTRRHESLKVSDILQPSALQRAFWIYAGAGSGDPAILTVRFTVSGPVKDESLQIAWNATISQHEMLRASINKDKSNEPLLVVREHLQQRIAWLPSDNSPEISISLSKAPAHKLHCRIISPESRLFYWHCHHALLDGWSAQIVLQDFLANYKQIIKGRTPVVSAETNYLSVHRQLLQANNSWSGYFWKQRLKGFLQPQLLTHGASATGKKKPELLESELLDHSSTEKLNVLCRQSKTTVSTALQTLYLYFIGLLCDQDDVIIGTAVSGRPAHISNIESVVGCLSTVVPIRLKLDPAKSFEQHIKNVQAEFFAAADHQQLGIASILDQAEPACRSSLFDSLLVIENFTTSTSDADTANEPLITDFSSGIVSSYPLTITLIPGSSWRIRCDFDADKISRQWVEAMQLSLTGLITRLTSEWSTPLQALNETLSDITPQHPNTGVLDHRNTNYSSREEQFDQLEGPGNQTELEIVALWEEVLHLRPISTDDRFFDIGGTSLQAVRLIEKIYQCCGCRLPASIFMKNPTIKMCAEEIASMGTRAAPVQCLVPLKTSGQSPALFCLHAGGGHAMFYRDFALSLPADIPCYAIQPKGIDGQEAPLTDIRKMAAHYIDEIQSVQPNGPYNLLCYCFGGALMLEMVHQLEQKNESVGHLLVADAPAPVPVSHPMAHLGWRAFLLYEFIVQKRWSLLANAVKKQLKNLCDGAASEIPRNDQPKTLAAVQAACVTGFNQYRAHPTELAVTFLNAGHGDDENTSACYMRNWKTLTPNRRDYQLSGDHEFIFDQPNVVETARVVGEILRTSTENVSQRVDFAEPVGRVVTI